MPPVNSIDLEIEGQKELEQQYRLVKNNNPSNNLLVTALLRLL